MRSKVFEVIAQLISDLESYKRARPRANKADIERHFLTISAAIKQRSVYQANNFAFRFSEANTASFSNVVLSLSALKNYDRGPFVLCIVRPKSLDFRLINSSFLKRISHSSHSLSLTNVKGSFLGHDIFTELGTIANSPENFEQLFAPHEAFSWQDNVERLVAATNSIVPRLARFEISPQQVEMLMRSPALAKTTIELEIFSKVEGSLANTVRLNEKALLDAARIENVNLRGNAIEQLITSSTNAHRLDDIVFEFNGRRLVIDIKTKLLDRVSAPKGYNIDKVIRLLSDGKSDFAFFFIGIATDQAAVKSRLVSIFDPLIVRATRIQTHWAGRASRGVTQLTGDIAGIFHPSYSASIDEGDAVRLLRSFVER